MKTYPIMLNVQGRLAVVVGGGDVGLRKAKSLAEARANVKLIAGSALKGCAPPGVTVAAEPYRPEHLTGAAIVFACTDDSRLNSAIAADARRTGALVNVADCPAECDFYCPAVASDGDVVVAVGTGGSSPALARHLRDHLEGHLPAGAGRFAALLGRLRERVRNEVPDSGKRREILNRLAEKVTFETFINEGADAVAALFEDIIASA